MILMMAVGIAGGVGAIGRYLTDGAIQDRSRGILPLGTMTVNVVGSFVMGVLGGFVLFHNAGTNAMAVIGTGFCGGFTTWSTASWETLRLFEDDAFGAGVVNAVGGIAGSIATAGVGLLLASVL